MKQVGIFDVSQKKKMQSGMLIFESTFQDICKINPDFKNSNLRFLFAQPAVKSIMIMLYETLDGERRRTITGSTEQWADDGEIKEFARMLALAKDIDVEFDDGTGPKRVVPTKREDRDMLKDMLRHMQSSHG